MIAEPAARAKGEIRVSMEQCAWCNAVKVGPRYERIPRLPLLSWEWCVALPLVALSVGVTHGACPDCIAEMRSQMRRSA